MAGISIHAPTWGATSANDLTDERAGFQSTHPRGVRRTRGAGAPAEREISIHAPTWGATQSFRPKADPDRISIHAPTWGATRAVLAAGKIVQFQSTHPRGVRPKGAKARYALMDFNPRTHVGCDAITVIFERDFLISIHAPTWGATVHSLLVVRLPGISIHAPTWGATGVIDLLKRLEAFQSTHPRGVRRGNDGWDSEIDGISIHAPTWGATRPSCSPCRRSAYFNPRTHVGCDRDGQGDRTLTRISIHAPTWGATRGFSLLPGEESFQSTHPRGVRLDTKQLDNAWLIFQSTHPRGVRQLTRDELIEMALFQSTHPRGVRPASSPSTPRAWEISIHAPTWGATQEGWSLDRFNKFQSTHPRGVRLNAATLLLISSNFNPRTHVGCDPPRRTPVRPSWNFNPRTHVGCDSRGLVA